MKKKLLLLLAIVTLMTIGLQGQDFKVKKQGLEFPDKKLQTQAWQGNEVINPPTSNVVIYAEIHGIDGDVLASGFQNHTQFYNLDVSLNATRGGPQNEPQGNPINKYFEVYKQIDKASVDLVEKFDLGQTINEIKFKFVLLSTGITELYRITVNDVRIKDLQLAYQYVEAGDPILFEKYTFTIQGMSYENMAEPEGVILNISGNE